MSEEMVRVLVTGTQKMRFRQERLIPRSRLNQYDQMCERIAKYQEFEKEFGDLIEAADPYDWDDIDDLEIEELYDEGVAVMATPSPLSPAQQERDDGP